MLCSRHEKSPRSRTPCDASLSFSAQGDFDLDRPRSSMPHRLLLPVAPAQQDELLLPPPLRPQAQAQAQNAQLEFLLRRRRCPPFSSSPSLQTPNAHDNAHPTTTVS